jgi:hypothetical protein
VEVGSAKSDEEVEVEQRKESSTDSVPYRVEGWGSRSDNEAWEDILKEGEVLLL